jgi:hypothetical protein
MAAESRVPSSKVPIGFPGQGLVRSVYKSMTESIDDMFFGPSMLDVIIQRLTRQAAEFVGIEGSGVNDEDLVARALKASGRSASEATLLRLPADLKPLEGETSTSTFSAPICDLLLEIFELDEKKNWLRRQAVVIILQQVFGETIERFVNLLLLDIDSDFRCRKLRETVSSLFTDTRLLSYIKSFRDGLWPGGQLKPPSVPRTAEEKVRTRDDANRKLSALIPGKHAFTTPCLRVFTSGRSCRKHDRALKRAARCTTDLRRPSKPAVEPAHRIYHHRRGKHPTPLASLALIRRSFRFLLCFSPSPENEPTHEHTHTITHYT